MSWKAPVSCSAISFIAGNELFVGDGGAFDGTADEIVVDALGEIAAVELINHPPLFGEFAASIRHEDNDAGSTATYRFRFAARPKFLRWLLEPFMLKALRAETAKRLKALSQFLSETQMANKSMQADASPAL